MKKENTQRVLLGMGAAVFLAAALWRPDSTGRGASQGLLLWYTKVLPIQFPFVIGARILLKIGLSEWLGPRLKKIMNCLFHLPGEAGTVWLTGMLAGYPTGAFFSAKLYEEGKIRKEGLLPLILLSNTAGPLFVVGTIGAAMLGDRRWGWLLLGIHWMGAIVTGWLFRPSKIHEPVITDKTGDGTKIDIGKIIGDSAQEAAEVMVKVGEFIVLFSVIGELLPLPQWNGWEGLLAGCLEITGGAARLTLNGGRSEAVLPALSFLIGFSGLSILMQTISVLGEVPVSAKKLGTAKLIQGAISAGLTGVLILVL